MRNVGDVYAFARITCPRQVNVKVPFFAVNVEKITLQCAPKSFIS